MLRTLALLALLATPLTASPAAPAQQSPAAPFTYQEVMIPMRDGTRLQTVIMRPTAKPGKLPILLQRAVWEVPTTLYVPVSGLTALATVLDQAAARIDQGRAN